MLDEVFLDHEIIEWEEISSHTVFYWHLWYEEIVYLFHTREHAWEICWPWLVLFLEECNFLRDYLHILDVCSILWEDSRSQQLISQKYVHDIEGYPGLFGEYFSRVLSRFLSRLSLTNYQIHSINLLALVGIFFDHKISISRRKMVSIERSVNCLEKRGF